MKTISELPHWWPKKSLFRADSRFVPSQLETALLCNDVSLWLGATPESALFIHGNHTLFYISGILMLHGIPSSHSQAPPCHRWYISQHCSLRCLPWEPLSWNYVTTVLGASLSLTATENIQLHRVKFTSIEYGSTKYFVQQDRYLRGRSLQKWHSI